MTSENGSLGPVGAGTEAVFDCDEEQPTDSAPAANAQPALRAYQRDVIGRTREAIAAGTRRPLLVAPTGSGKTVIASAMVQAEAAEGGRVLFLAHRRELIDQAASKLWSYGIDAGIILAGVTPRPEQQVQVASIQTLWARAWRRQKIDRPPADLIVLDEAHHVRAETYRKIIDSYPDAVVLGLTATPCRGDGRGLGNVFETMVECPSVESLIGMGFLVGTKVYAPSAPDLKGVRVERGDYVEAQLAQRVDTPKLVGDIVTHWHRLADGRKTVVFATGVQHSMHIRNEFARSGVWAEHIDGSTPIDEREKILSNLSAGKVQVVCNCMVLTEGWDQPDVSAIVLARPTKHMGLYRQMVGRVLRPAPGKAHALVLDHAGSTLMHGFAEDPVLWTLGEDRRAENPRQAVGADGGTRTLTTCPECAAVRLEGSPCPACGWRPRAKPQYLGHVDGDLIYLKRDGTRGGAHVDQQSFYLQIRAIGVERGWKPGAAAHRYKEKFGSFPPFSWNNLPPLDPEPAVRAWVRSRSIAYAKARASS